MTQGPFVFAHAQYTNISSCKTLDTFIGWLAGIFYCGLGWNKMGIQIGGKCNGILIPVLLVMHNFKII